MQGKKKVEAGSETIEVSVNQILSNKFYNIYLCVQLTEGGMVLVPKFVQYTEYNLSDCVRFVVFFI